MKKRRPLPGPPFRFSRPATDKEFVECKPHIIPLKNQRRLEQAARAMVTAVVATTWGEPDAAGRREQFLKLAKGIERTKLVQLGAEVLAADLNATPDAAERFLWFNLERFFDWVDLATVAPEGSA
jgi:hypothetical protein